MATEVIRLANVGTGAVHRESARLAGGGLVTVTPVGRRRLCQANRDSPVFADLHGLVLKTVGLAEPLREALAPLATQMTVAFVYGSLARGTDTIRSDVDLMVLSDGPSYAELFAALEGAEERIGRKVNPNLLSVEERRNRRAEANHFVSTIAGQPKIFILGSASDLG